MVATPLYAALLALWFILLSARVSRLRLSKNIWLGDGGDARLQRAIRGHANFAEYVPLALVLLALLELGRTSIYLPHALGIVLVVARVLHGYALCYRASWRFGRFWGTALTLGVLGASAVLCLYHAYRAHLAWFAPGAL
jgi:uncharacterized protein